MTRKKTNSETCEEQLQTARKLSSDERIVEIAELESRAFKNNATVLTPYLSSSAVIVASLGIIGALVLENRATASNREASGAGGQIATPGGWGFLSTSDFWGAALIGLAVLLLLCLAGHILFCQHRRTYAQAVKDTQKLSIYRLIHQEVENSQIPPTILGAEDERIRLWLFREPSPRQNPEKTHP